MDPLNRATDLRYDANKNVDRITRCKDPPANTPTLDPHLGAAMPIVMGILLFVRGMLADRPRLAAENLALRQQVGVLKRTNSRPKLHWWDRVFCVWLAHVWTEWRSALLAVKPQTVPRWDREGFRLYLAKRGRGRGNEIGAGRGIKEGAGCTTATGAPPNPNYS